MIPKVFKKFTDFDDLVLHFQAIYYQQLKENKGIRSDLQEHKELIEKIEQRYLRHLTKYPEWDTEENQSVYRNSMDILTQVFTKTSQKEEKERIIQSLKSNLANRFK